MRVSEVYLSVQGEGPRVGTPTIFVRFGGCNLRCPGWPCDTQFAILPEFRKDWQQLTPKKVYDKIKQIMDNQMHPVNICFTGGEPFLQKHEELEELFNLLREDIYVGEIECFSNGTILYPQWAIGPIRFVMDWKLEGSGEDPFNEIRMTNVIQLGLMDTVKFTIKDIQDYNLAKYVYHEKLRNTAIEVYYGVVWGALDNETLVGWILEDGYDWKFNMQIHNIVWDRTKRGI